MPTSGWGRETTPNGICTMRLPRTAADVLNDHIELEMESLDRIYLNVIQHRLPAENGVA